MARGRKLALVTKDNVAQLPSQELIGKPREIDIAVAAELMPKTLSKAEQVVWNELAPQLAMLGRLQPHHVLAVADICYIRSEITRLRKELAKKKSTVYESSGRNGDQEKTRPDVAQINELFRQWRSMLGEFGLAPNSERSLTSKSKTPHDGFDEF